MAHYLFNLVKAGAQRPALRGHAAELLRVRMWGICADEPHRDELAPGDLVLIQAEFDVGLVRITAHEYETALAVAAGRARSTR